MRFRKLFATIVGAVLLGFLAWAVLILTNSISPRTGKLASIIVASLTIGLVYSFIGWPHRDFPQPSWSLLYYPGIGRLRATNNLLAFFGALYGGIFFYIAGQIGGGSVFGMNFSSTGHLPLSSLEGNLYSITFIGCLFGLYIAGLGPLVKDIINKNTINFLAILWVFLGGIGAVAISAFSGSPFFAIVFVSCVLSSFIFNRLEGDDLAGLGLGVLVFCFTLFPICAYLSA